ncbi:hypothetical protein KHA80_16265 [Anaerobacillus sp. HL2]|nr:hypothetical protein KHA80_16265 [Anaerobacillus sp. HL2]
MANYACCRVRSKIGSYVDRLIKVDYIDPIYYATKVFQLMLNIETTKSNLTVVNQCFYSRTKRNYC